MDLKHFTRVLLPPQITSTFSVFLSNYRNTSGGLGEREIMWEHESQTSVSTAFSSSPKPS